jgi:hypothetical protein
MRHLRRYCEELAGIDTWIGAISRERRGSAVFDKFVSDTEGLTAESYRRLESNPLVDSLMRIENFRQANHELFVGTDFEKAMDDQWVLSSLFFDWLEKNSYTSAQTNADGCFKMRIPESTRGFLFARASRALASDSEEHYYWIHELEAADDEEAAGVFFEQVRADLWTPVVTNEEAAGVLLPGGLVAGGDEERSGRRRRRRWFPGRAGRCGGVRCRCGIETGNAAAVTEGDPQVAVGIDGHAIGRGVDVAGAMTLRRLRRWPSVVVEGEHLACAGCRCNKRSCHRRTRRCHWSW